MHLFLCLLIVFGWDFIWLCSKVLQSFEVGLWRFYSPGSSQATGQSEMVAWRVSTVWSRNLVPQFSKHVVHWFCSIVLSFPTIPWYAWAEYPYLSPQVKELLDSRSCDTFTFNQVHFIDLLFIDQCKSEMLGTRVSPRESSDFQAQKRVLHKDNQLNLYANTEFFCFNQLP